MVSLNPPVCDFGANIVNFSLLNIDGKTVTLNDVQGPNGTLIMFICNHCPYVKAITERLVEDVIELQNQGIGVAAIMSNAAEMVEADSFENMQIFAKINGFTFPYLIDKSQQTGKDFGAVCTPDFFGYNSLGKLQYRGRLDSAGRHPSDENLPRELKNAMLFVAKTGKGPVDQIPSIGCSIKWRDAT